MAVSAEKIDLLAPHCIVERIAVQQDDSGASSNVIIAGSGHR